MSRNSILLLPQERLNAAASIEHAWDPACQPYLQQKTQQWSDEVNVVPLTMQRFLAKRSALKPPPIPTAAQTLG